MLRVLLLAAILLCPAQADDRSDAVDRILAPFKTPSAPGCAIGIIHHGQFVYTAAFGLADLQHRVPITAATAFNVASLTKQFTAAALYYLIESGRVHLTDSVRRFVPEMPAYADAITIGDLLHHTSGLRDLNPLQEVAGRLAERLSASESLDLLARQSALNFAPGTDYEYSNSDYFLLGLIVERVSGKPLGEFARERIFGPLGMTHSVFEGQVDGLANVAQGFAGYAPHFHRAPKPPLSDGAGGLYTTLDDLLRWDQVFYTASPMTDFLQTRGTLSTGERIDYAGGLTVGRYRGLRIVSHNGWLPGYSADLTRFPVQQLTVACLCNRGDVEAAGLSRTIAAVYLHGRLHRLSPGMDISYPDSGFAELDGVWESRQGWLVRTWSAPDGLWVETSDGRRKLAPLNHTQLFADDAGFRVTLTRLAPDRIQLEWEGQRAEIYSRLKAELPHRNELAAYNGIYFSRDADTRWSFFVDDGRLILSNDQGWKLPLDAAGADRFIIGPWTLRFVRSPQGAVRGLELHRERLWNLSFEKTR